MILKFAFRNVFRNKKRSFLTATAIFFGAFVVALAQGWAGGMFDMLKSNMIMYQSGNVRIITENYKERERFLPVDEVIYNYQDIIVRLKAMEEVKRVEERIRFGIMLGKDDSTVFGLGFGINLEDNIFNLEDKLIEGKVDSNGIIVGEELARKLNVKIGDELLLATKTSEGGLNGIKLPIVGTINLGLRLFNEKAFFIQTEQAKKLLKIQNGTTEIYVYTKKHEDSELVRDRIEKFLPEGVVALTYHEQIGAWVDFMEIEERIIHIVLIAIMFLASFVVINTMIKAIFERLREIGTLKAIGMTNTQIFINFTMEGAIIGAFGGILGSLGGVLFLFYLNKTGVDVSSASEGSDMLFNFIIRPPYSFSIFFYTAIVAIIVPAIAAMIPARYANKFTPAEVLRKI